MKLNWQNITHNMVFLLNVPLFTEPPATNLDRGSPKNNENDFPDVYERPVHIRQQAPAFFIRFTNET